MNLNQKCVVASDHKFWPGRIGYFQFFANIDNTIVPDNNGSIAIFSDTPSASPHKGRLTLFAVKVGQFKEAN